MPSRPHPRHRTAPAHRRPRSATVVGSVLAAGAVVLGMAGHAGEASVPRPAELAAATSVVTTDLTSTVTVPSTDTSASGPASTTGHGAGVRSATRARADVATRPLDPASVQRELVELSFAYEAARTEAEQADAVAADHDQQALAAEVRARAAKAAFLAVLDDLYREGPLQNAVTVVLAGSAGSIREAAAQAGSARMVAESTHAILAEAQVAQARADLLAAEARRLREAATLARTDAKQTLRAVRIRAAELAEELGSGARAARYVSATQRARDEAASAAWRGYLGDLRRARVSPPPAEALLPPVPLPAPLRPLRGSTGRPVAGVAATSHGGATLAVLPRETVRAISYALSQLGKAYAPRTAGPSTFDCSGLVAAAWAAAGRSLPSRPEAQFLSTRTVDPTDIQVGDSVFFASTESGVHHVGINLGGGLMLSADPVTSRVAVQPFAGKPFAVTRPALGPPPGRKQAPASDSDSPLRCGGLATDTSLGMVLPVREGDYRLTAGFGESGPLWAALHTGLDFSAARGTSVFAAKAGTVSLERSDWAGPHHLLIDHGDGLVTSYAHLDQALVVPGQRVQAGAVIGVVGEKGNATGPHLHFEVHVDGTPVDPLLFLAGEGGAAGGWGGHTNGMIPAEALCAVAGARGHRLRCDAAQSASALSAAYLRRFGRPLCVTDSYRSLAQQLSVYARKPSLAAVPGTSHHGWGLALDLCGGVESFGTPQHTWMAANAPRFGWVHPDWARPGGGREEPWHWEYSPA